jgi:Tol biopolymer transport system component
MLKRTLSQWISIRRLAFIAALFLVLPLTGQSMAERKELFDDGEFFFNSEDYKEAVFYYQKLQAINPANGNINFQLGMCYINIPGEEPKAIPYLEKAIEKISVKYKKSTFEETRAPLHAYFYLAQAYRINNQLDKALQMLDKFTSSKYFEGNYNQGIVTTEVEACKRAKVIQDKPIEANFEKLPEPVNTAVDNFNAVVSADETVIFYMTNKKFYNAVMMSRKVDGIWSEPENITPQVGSDGDCYPTGISSDGKDLYLVKKVKNNNDIFVSHWDNDKWSVMVPLNENINSSKNETHACVSPDGNELYFTSNRKGSLGGIDIWRSKKENGDWGKAENLGTSINTELDEDSPFLNSSGDILYFSSQGHQNMGGFDIFYSRKKGMEWSPASNLGFPVNTTSDNRFWCPVGKGTTGYLTRKTDDASLMDIYRVSITGGDQLKDLLSE